MKRIIILAAWLWVFSLSGFSQATAEKFADLATVESFPQDQAVGTVFVVLQKHLDLRKDRILDQENLAIAKIQGQISKIILRLHADNSVSRVLVEGEEYRQLTEGNDKKLYFVAETKRRLDSCRGVLADETALVSAYPGFSDQAKQLLRNILNTRAAERFTTTSYLSFLIGGAHVAYAESSGKIQLFGGEDRDLNAESLELAMKLLEISERLQAISGVSTSQPSIFTVRVSDFLVESELLKTVFSGVPDSSPLWANTQKLTNCLSVLPREDAPTIVILDSSSNPFNSITDRAILSGLREAAEKEFQEVAVTQRSNKAAELAGRMLKDAGQTVGAVVFGSDHKEGLVRALTAGGYSVVVLTPLLLVTGK